MQPIEPLCKLAFLPFTQKTCRQPIPENFLLYPTFCCGCPYEEKNPKNLFYLRAEHVWDTQYKNTLIFFSLIKKIFLQPLEIIFRYNFLFSFGSFWFWEKEENKRGKEEIKGNKECR